MYRTQLLLILIYFVTSSCVNPSSLDNKRQRQIDKQHRKKRQAISLGVAQSGALRLYPQNRDNKDSNSTLASEKLETILQKYAQVIKEQAQNDIKARHKNGGLNITESIYNASIAFAIDNNRTSALHNNTIHLLKNLSSTEQQPAQPNPIVSLLDVSNTTLQNRTITIPRTNFTAPRADENNYLEINGINKTNLFINKTVVLTDENSENRGNINFNMTNSTYNGQGILLKIPDGQRNQTDLTNATITQEIMPETPKFIINANNTTNVANTPETGIESSENRDNVTKNLPNTTNRQEILGELFGQPNVENKNRVRYHVPSHFTYVYYINKMAGNSSSMSRKIAEEENVKEEGGNDYIDEGHGILVGPLDDMPDHPNGNGPQDKQLKDLGGSRIAGQGTNNTRTDQRKKRKKQSQKNQKRPKRQLSNFRTMGMHQPWEYSINSEQFENNGRFNEQAHAYVSSRESNEEEPWLRSLYEASAATNANLAKTIASRDNMWMPTERSIFGTNNPYENDIPYKKYLEREANSVERHPHPIINSRYNIDNLIQLSQHPLYNSPAIVDKRPNPAINPRYNIDEMVDRTQQPLLQTPTILDEDSPVYKANPKSLLPRSHYDASPSTREYHSFNTEGFAINPTPFIPSFPRNRDSLPISRDLPSTSSFAGNQESPYSSTPYGLEQRNSRDQMIQNFLNRYDAQTKILAGLYNQIQQDSRAPIENSRQLNYDQLQDPQSGSLNIQYNPLLSRINPYFHSPILPLDKMYDNVQRSGLYQNDRRNILERHTNVGPFEIDIRSKRPTQLPFNNNLDPALIKKFMQPFEYQNNLPQENLQNNLLSRLIPNTYPYKRTLEKPSVQPLFNSLSLQNNNLFSQRTGLSPQASISSLLFQNTLSSLSPAGKSNPQNEPHLEPSEEYGVTNNNKYSHDAITKKEGVVMLMVTSLPDDENDDKREEIEHRELTPDGITRASSNVTDSEDFSLNLKKAANYVLSKAVSDGNITSVQRRTIESKLDKILERQYKNKTRGELRAITRAEIPNACEDTMTECENFKAGGVCPFMVNFMKGTCTKTCKACLFQEHPQQQLKVSDFFEKPTSADSIVSHVLPSLNNQISKKKYVDVTGSQRSLLEPEVAHRLVIKQNKIADDPVMYLTFEHATKDGVIEDNSGNKNNALLEKGASISPRVLGTCGKAAELNEGSVTWSGEEFKRKPDAAISIAMYVKVKKSGVINWFANGQTGDRTFYTKTKGSVVPAKVWTHVAGTYDSESGLARIYINGELEQEQTQRKGEKLSKNWLVNGIGAGFGDDSLHYTDEVLIYDRALVQSEVKMLFNRCMFNRMVLHFGFQKGNKTSIADQSGLDNNAILIGGARQKEDCDRCGFCLDLTKGPDPTMKIERITVKKLPRTKISIALWLSLNSTKGLHNIFTTESSEGNIGYRLQVVNGRIRWAIGTDTVPVIFDHMTESEVIPEALWTHIVTTYNTETGVVKIYANSIEKLKEYVPDDRREFLPSNWDNDASIGDKTLRGYMDEFIMYNWDLDSSEALYVRNYCADHPKLVRFTVRVPLTKKTEVPHISRVPLTKKTEAIDTDNKKKENIPRSSIQRPRYVLPKPYYFNQQTKALNNNSYTKLSNIYGMYQPIYTSNMYRMYQPYLQNISLITRDIKRKQMPLTSSLLQLRSFTGKSNSHKQKPVLKQTNNKEYTNVKTDTQKRVLTPGHKYSVRNWWDLYSKIVKNDKSLRRKTIAEKRHPISSDETFFMLKRRKKSEKT